MRSTVAFTFDRRHGYAFELTCVCSNAETHFTHTHSARMRSNVRMCDRSHAFWTSTWPFLGHLLPSLLHFPSAPYRTFLIFSHHAPPPITPNHHPTAQTPPHHHHSTSAPQPITTIGLPITSFLHFSIFFHFFSQTQPSPNSAICPCFWAFRGTIHPRIVPLLFFYGFSLLQRVRFGF